ncbi:trypsin-like serine protease [Arvimicrobium flavum]|uniref:trypsin-like serine protease n=1 Tax=Arvimicrobium flavum TaxID=3393320 RepID=UPI00237C20CA|nr:trypsin-like serine protease [Mesorhizobium shangrilense]
MSFLPNEDVYPYTTVVYVEARFGSNWVVGSGVLVGANDVLTASHMIYDPNYGAADEVLVYASYNPSQFNTSYSAVYLEYFTDFDPDGDGFLFPGDGSPLTLGGAELDIALISLSAPIGNAQGWMGMDPNFWSGSINVTGFPGYANGYMVADTGFALVDRTDYYIDISAMDINPGNSGGPVWVNTSSGPYVVGVVSTGGAAATVDGHAWLFTSIIENDIYIDGLVLFGARDMELVAATYQFFTGAVPGEAGFLYLIDSPGNASDLNDAYYAVFNQENRFINFANNLGAFGVGADAFDAAYGGLSFNQAVAKAYDAIVGIAAAEGAGIDVAAALAFFQGSIGFYTAVALERVTPSGVPLAEATKLVMIGSVLHESMKADVGLYAGAVNDFVSDYMSDGEAFFGLSLFA